MKSEERQTYIALRSRGYSMRGAAGAVSVSLSTAERWEESARLEIADKRESRLAGLYKRYAIGREDLLIRAAETLEQIDGRLESLIESGEPREVERFIKLKLSALSLLDRLHIPLAGDFEGEPTKRDLQMLFVNLSKVLNVGTVNALERDTEPLEPIETGTK